MNRILVRAPNWIGDQILAYPFYRELRQAYPKAWIGVVCTEWVADIQFRGLVDEVFVLPKRRGDSVLKSAWTIFQFASKIKTTGNWDLGITLPNSFGSALLLKLAGVQVRRGYNTDMRGFLLNDRMEWSDSSDTHRAQAYLNLLSAELKGRIADARDYWTDYSAETQFDAIANWPNAQTIQPPEENYFIVAPGATADSRRWSVGQFADLIRMLREKKGWRAVIVGGRAEKEIAGQLIELGLNIEDATGKGSVAAHWKLFRQAKVSICNESGLAHVAALCGSPVQIICGAADPKRTRPIGPGHVQVTINPVECWPCERNLCRFRDLRQNQCLNGIEPARVIEEMDAGFNRHT